MMMQIKVSSRLLFKMDLNLNLMKLQQRMGIFCSFIVFWGKMVLCRFCYSMGL